MKSVISLCVLLGSFQLAADSPYDSHSQSQIDYSRCLDAQLEHAERELQTWENIHLFKLHEMAEKTGRDDLLKVFRSIRRFDLIAHYARNLHRLFIYSNGLGAYSTQDKL